MRLNRPKSPHPIQKPYRNWYNATARKRRWNVQQPHCALIVNSNKACGEKLPATLSRLIRLWIPTAEMPTTPGFDLEPFFGSKDSSLNENLMPYLEAMASVGTPEELASFLECMANLTQQQQEAVWLAAPVEVINQLERLGFDRENGFQAPS